MVGNCSKNLLHSKNDLDELKNLIVLHAKSQKLPEKAYQPILESIKTLDEGVEDSWVSQWEKQGDIYYQKADYKNAMQYYNFARFPYIDNSKKQLAHKKCIKAFKHWVENSNLPISREYCDYDNKKIPFYYLPSKKDKKRLLVIMGGIVSIKEQWSQLLPLFHKLNFSVMLCEMPGVGENTLTYDESAHLFLDELIRTVVLKSLNTDIYIIALSFSGHMAIKAALINPKIKYITTVGAPLYHFFTDKNWFQVVPKTTKATLSHLLGVELKEVFPMINKFAIEKSELHALKAQLNYVFSTYDEIIPGAEKVFLQENVKNACIEEYPDVHGSPNHMLGIKLFILNSLFTQARIKPFCNLLLTGIISVNKWVNA